VRDLCGDYSGPFMLDQCHIGLFSLLLLLLMFVLMISIVASLAEYCITVNFHLSSVLPMKPARLIIIIIIGWRVLGRT